jgi:hypothetical protein
VWDCFRHCLTKVGLSPGVLASLVILKALTPANRKPRKACRLCGSFFVPALQKQAFDAGFKKITPLF